MFSLAAVRKFLVAVVTDAGMVAADPSVVQHWAGIIVLVANAVGVYAVPNAAAYVRH